MLIFWDKLNGKIKTAYMHKQYFFELLEFCTGIFEWSIPDGIDPKYLERALHADGMCAITKNAAGEYRLSFGGLQPPLDQYGIGTRWIGNCLNGEYCEGIRGETAAVCFNNSDHTPNLDLVPVSDRLTEFDKSIAAFTRSSRAMPLTIAHDEQTVKAFNAVQQQITDGEIVSIMSENVMDDFAGKRSVEVVEFTKPQYMQLIQYLYEAKESEYRNFYRKYGQNLQSTPKRAQIISEEIDGADSVCFIIPRDMLLQRERFCEEAARIFGDDFAVKFADPWASEEQRYDADTEKQEAEADKAEAEADKAETEAETAAEPDGTEPEAAADDQSEEVPDDERE